MKKKIFALCLCIAMIAIAVVGGTLAYFTDTGAATNTFTVGSVEIELLESQFHRVNDNATDEQIIADAETYQEEYLAVQGADIVPGRWVRKAPYILNTGNNPAYVRVRLLADQGFGDKLDVMTTTTAVQDGSIIRTASGTRTIDGRVYDVLTFVYTQPLDPEEMTYWPAFWQFKLNEACDNEEVAELIEDDVLTEDGEFNIFVEADAIQSEGFENATAAFAAFDAQMTPAA